MFLAKSNVGHKLCRPNDVVINTLWAWMAALGVTKHSGIVSPAYGVYRPIGSSDLLPEFADRLLRTPSYATEYLCRSTGVNSSRMRLYPEHFLRIPIILPPVEEQAWIVRFLNRVNARLERAIRAKRKIIGLLNEQKQAIVHRAITCGLDGSTPLRASGMQWLGDIPQHWSQRRFKFLARINTGQVDPRRAEYRNLALIAPNHIESGTGRLLEHETAAEQGADSGKYQVRRGQIIQQDSSEPPQSRDCSVRLPMQRRHVSDVLDHSGIVYRVFPALVAFTTVHQVCGGHFDASRDAESQP